MSLIKKRNLYHIFDSTFILIALTIISFTVLTSFSFSDDHPINNPNASAIQKVRTIVLDAGHGGKDPGAEGTRGREKEIALQIVLKLGKKIQQEFPGIKVIYTRSTDKFLPLYERPAVANKHHADLFISVHCNSAGSRSARGTETFVVGYSRSSDQDVAMRENASILLEENYQDNYSGFDPKDPSTYIVFQMMKKQYRTQSINLARHIQQEFSKSGRPNRGVKEASFAVLRTAGMPAVLTEIGFISNSQEQTYLLSAQGQKEIVDNLFDAINTYRKNIER